jgi:hypothetical protein
VEGIRGVDVIYMTRIQKERFALEADYKRVCGAFVLTPRLLNEACPEDNDAVLVAGWFPLLFCINKMLLFILPFIFI